MRREDDEELSVLEVGGKPRRIIPGENPGSQLGTENPIVPLLRFEPGPRGGRQGEHHYTNVTTLTHLLCKNFYHFTCKACLCLASRFLVSVGPLFCWASSQING